MNKLLLSTALAAACGFAVVAAPAFAQATNDQSAAQPATIAAQPAAKTKADAKRPVPAPGSRNCIRETGSHIPPPKGQCLPVVGNSYSQEDLRRTGQMDVGRALEMLDPSVQVHSH